MVDIPKPATIAGYQLRQRSVATQQWGGWRDASEAEYIALHEKSGWQGREVYCLDDLIANGELVTLIEATSWQHPKDAPEDERLLVKLGSVQTFTCAERKRSGVWITVGGSELPAEVVTAWKRVILPGAHLERGAHGQG